MSVENKDSIINDQEKLLIECRSMLDDLIKNKPDFACKKYGSTTLGNLKAELFKYKK